MENEKMHQVTLNEFDVHELRQAAREGRLFLLPKQMVNDEPSSTRQSIRDYVATIDECASPAYKSCIQRLWTAILTTPQLFDMLIFHRGKNDGLPNKYRITALVAFLQEQGVYRREFTPLSLHLRMEHTDRRNSAYTGMSRYYLEQEQKRLLKKLLSQLIL